MVFRRLWMLTISQRRCHLTLALCGAEEHQAPSCCSLDSSSSSWSDVHLHPSKVSDHVQPRLASAPSACVDSIALSLSRRLRPRLRLCPSTTTLHQHLLATSHHVSRRRHYSLRDWLWPRHSRARPRIRIRTVRHQLLASDLPPVLRCPRHHAPVMLDRGRIPSLPPSNLLPPTLVVPPSESPDPASSPPSRPRARRPCDPGNPTIEGVY
jgi:hypothetical protein